MTDSLPAQWTDEAKAAGLGRIWVLSRDAIEAAFVTPTGSTALPPPSHWHPGYTRALLLASTGRTLWENLLAARTPQAPPLEPDDDPLDRHTKSVVEALALTLRAQDPGLVTLYPFHHERQLLGFPRLTANQPWSQTTPLGILVDPDYGPWFAWRALLLTRLDLEPTPLPDPSPCTTCLQTAPAGSTPCIQTCPAQAVTAQGFHWETCAKQRVDHPPCQHTCPARIACPIGTEHRYNPDQLKHHYTASLQEIRKHLS